MNERARRCCCIGQHCRCCLPSSLPSSRATLGRNPTQPLYTHPHMHQPPGPCQDCSPAPGPRPSFPRTGLGCTPPTHPPYHKQHPYRHQPPSPTPQAPSAPPHPVPSTARTRTCTRPRPPPPPVPFTPRPAPHRRPAARAALGDQRVVGAVGRRDHKGGRGPVLPLLAQDLALVRGQGVEGHAGAEGGGAAEALGENVACSTRGVCRWVGGCGWGLGRGGLRRARPQHRQEKASVCVCGSSTSGRLAPRLALLRLPSAPHPNPTHPRCTSPAAPPAPPRRAAPPA